MVIIKLASMRKEIYMSRKISRIALGIKQKKNEVH